MQKLSATVIWRTIRKNPIATSCLPSLACPPSMQKLRSRYAQEMGERVTAARFLRRQYRHRRSLVTVPHRGRVSALWRPFRDRPVQCVLLDFRTLESGSPINCDICIIGAGAAGITLACSLIDSGIRVCLLESGGLERSPDIQDLYDGERVGLANADPLTCRLRRFGGTTNRWMGWCAPLRNIDFEPRPWIPHSGSPIRRADLDPCTRKPGNMFQIGSFGYEERASIWMRNISSPPSVRRRPISDSSVSARRRNLAWFIAKS